MRIRSPKDFVYPITVSKLNYQPGDVIERFKPLFDYTYQSVVTEVDRYGDERAVTKTLRTEFQSESEGTVSGWSIKEGDVIDEPGIPLLEVEEICKHEIQFGGLCTNCGKDMTLMDYGTTQRDDQRATISAAPRQTALKVSTDEASRTSDAAIKRLLSVKKLSLVVDLDQTIIHATVDPTVEDWRKDENNPNYEALKDVKSFHLSDGGPRGGGCWYHIKLRPGLRQFLQDMSRKYDMHIYTMGTRPYAQNIAEIIDPDHKIFADKILSRDESGSLTLKTLQKLFPMDQRMVVVIDDRGDIWNWSANLIKVNPYDFFVGIGDVNSSFLPKRTDLGVKAPPPPVPPPSKAGNGAKETAETSGGVSEQKGEEPSSSQASVSSIDQQLLAMSAGDNPEMLEERTHEQEEVIAAQIVDRPLLRQQEELDKQDEDEAIQEQNGEAHSETPSESGSQRHRHNLLRDDDIELTYLQRSLERVHQAFYEEYERRSTGSFGRVAQLRGEKSSKVRPGEELASVPDVTEIMPPLKRQILKDVVICFTGVIPQGTDHATSDLGIWAQTFGATVSPSLTKSTTHVIAHKDRRTSKVRKAAQHTQIKIVTTQWLFQCFAQWEKIDETPYLIDVERDEHGSHESLPFGDLPNVLSSTEEDIDEEDEIDDGGEFSPPPLAENESPIEMTEDQWGTMNDEVDEWLASEGDDNDEDEEGSESDASRRSVRTNNTNGTRPSTGSRRKRKRGTESAEVSDVENDSDTSVNGLTGSRLEHRKKRARQRTSALNNATSALSDKSSGLPSPDTTGPEEEPVQKDAGGTGDDDDGDELALAMLEEFEREESEENAASA